MPFHRAAMLGWQESLILLAQLVRGRDRCPSSKLSCPFSTIIRHAAGQAVLNSLAKKSWGRPRGHGSAISIMSPQWSGWGDAAGRAAGGIGRRRLVASDTAIGPEICVLPAGAGFSGSVASFIYGSSAAAARLIDPGTSTFRRLGTRRGVRCFESTYVTFRHSRRMRAAGGGAYPVGARWACERMAPCSSQGA